MKHCLPLLAFALATTAHAAVVLTDNFNDTSNWTKAGDPFTAESTADTGNLFGGGTENNYLNLVFTAGSSIHVLHTAQSLSLGTTGQIAFDFYEPVVDGATGAGIILRLGTNTGNGGTAFAVSLRRGGLFAANLPSVGVDTANPIATYSQLSRHTLTVVFNNTASSISYGNDNYTLAGSQIDVWLDGARVGSGLAAVAGNSLTGSNITTINFTDKAGTASTLYLDNFEARTDITIGTTVPEPATEATLAGLLALAGTLVLRHWRRRG